MSKKYAVSFVPNQEFKEGKRKYYKIIEVAKSNCYYTAKLHVEASNTKRI